MDAAGQRLVRLEIGKLEPPMKHAGSETVARLEPMLRQLRARGDLIERSPGTFYRKSQAFLHFHEHPAGIFADLKDDLRTFQRYRVSTRDEQRRLLRLINLALGESQPFLSETPLVMIKAAPDPLK